MDRTLNVRSSTIYRYALALLVILVTPLFFATKLEVINNASIVLLPLTDLTLIYILEAPVDVCNPSPCGPNSQCRQVNGQAVCSCVPGYIGSPPSCRPECVSSPECPLIQACVNQKCIDPCPGTCGVSAICKVFNHNPHCHCPEGMTGDPFVNCHLKGKVFRF